MSRPEMLGRRPPTVVGWVEEIHRFPVKSMQGGALREVALRRSGVTGDRSWALRDLETDEITSAKRFPRILECKANYTGEGGDEVEITLPDGARIRSSDPDVSRRISEALRHPLRLEPLAPASDRRHYRLRELRTPARLRKLLAVRKGGPLPDISLLPFSKLWTLFRYATPPGTYVDTCPVHIVTVESMSALAGMTGLPIQSARFRPNFVVRLASSGREFDELAWAGRTLRVGGAELGVEAGTFRCGMPAHAQGPSVPKAPAVVRTIYERLGTTFGISATVAREGTVRVGDEITLSASDDRAGESLPGRLVRTLKRRMTDAYLSL